MSTLTWKCTQSLKKTTCNGVDLVKHEIKVLKTRISEREDEIEDLKHVNKVAREVSNRVHKELSDTKNRFKEEHAVNLKDQKA